MEVDLGQDQIHIFVDGVVGGLSVVQAAAYFIDGIDGLVVGIIGFPVQKGHIDDDVIDDHIVPDLVQEVFRIEVCHGFQPFGLQQDVSVGIPHAGGFQDFGSGKVPLCLADLLQRHVVIHLIDGIRCIGLLYGHHAVRDQPFEVEAVGNSLPGFLSGIAQALQDSCSGFGVDGLIDIIAFIHLPVIAGILQKERSGAQIDGVPFGVHQIRGHIEGQGLDPVQDGVIVADIGGHLLQGICLLQGTYDLFQRLQSFFVAAVPVHEKVIVGSDQVQIRGRNGPVLDQVHQGCPDFHLLLGHGIIGAVAVGKRSGGKPFFVDGGVEVVLFRYFKGGVHGPEDRVVGPGISFVGGISFVVVISCPGAAFLCALFFLFGFPGEIPRPFGGAACAGQGSRKYIYKRSVFVFFQDFCLHRELTGLFIPYHTLKTWPVLFFLR